MVFLKDSSFVLQITSDLEKVIKAKEAKMMESSDDNLIKKTLEKEKDHRKK